MNACEFDPLPEHKPDECPRCNPEGWMSLGEVAPEPAVECHECGRAIADQLLLSQHRVLAHGWGKEDN